ncbi:MAG: heparinase II/III family protein [Haliscomenobacter sp.]|nr:heparinase II/III family protein [Haliscomenobacter sp.]
MSFFVWPGNDPKALWLGIKGGINGSEHSHLDLGNFELEAGGVRWAKDLGSDDYNLPGYWTMGVNGQR